LLERGCRGCGGELGRLVRHQAAGGGTQVWLSCCACGARLQGALPHHEHPLLSLYPVWREGGCDYLLPEELEQAARPLTFVEVVRAVFDGGDPMAAQ